MRSLSRQEKSLGLFGNIHVTLQWIYCKEKYFEQGLKRLEETLKEETV